MTRYFYDTEFLEDGSTIELISIGIVAEDGREYYAVNAEMPMDRIRKHDWLVRNVLPHLPLTSRTSLDKYLGNPPNSFPRPPIDFVGLDRATTCVKPRQVIANEVRDFLLAGVSKPELWAWYGAYDHVVLCQLWGRMIDLPKGVPMWTNDLRQEVHRLGDPQPPEQLGGEHNALEDARHLKAMHQYLQHIREVLDTDT
ncbi:MAG: hypothetical protein HOQ21_10065 [Dermatophilaceae bacterium]|nr:hypothetical protein [Dermatophilaceae bacterium]